MLRNLLLSSNGLELDSVISVDSPTGRATFIEVFFNVVPAKTTNLAIHEQLITTLCKYADPPDIRRYRA